MSGALDRLTAALADRYRLERELGQGGMATVYLARDLKHERQVAIKVLRPDLAASLGGERFTREIKVAAALQHPHILPLLDSGGTGDLLYYVMPYVEGESLRDRLTREGELPIADAARILAEVCDALAAAHAKGIVHRDIKPDNVMLSGRHALVMDFGVAKAIAEGNRPERTSGARDPSPLTTIGVALGTPAYMAPEQAVADPAIDHRVDIYALGVMGYELLVGTPPFVGRSAQEVLAAHVTQPPASITARRPAVPEAFAEVVMRCLEKRPADRWQSAEELLPQLGALATPGTGMTPTATRRVTAARPAGRWRRIAAGVAAMAVAAAAFFGLRGTGSTPEADLDPNLIAVLPFAVSGPDLPASDGMVYLLAAHYTGDGGPRAIDPRSAIAAWERRVGEGAAAARAIAREMGAGQYLLGSAVQTGRTLVLSAEVSRLDLAESEPFSVEGPVDSLTGLIEELAGKLLAGNAGLTGRRASYLPRSLDAIRAYVDGRAALRRSAWDEALSEFGQAIAIDSNFTLAQLGFIEAAGWTTSVPVEGLPRIKELAWEARSRLAPRDRAMLVGYTGGKGPAPSSGADWLEGWQAAVAEFPDLAEAWNWLGEAYVHVGDPLSEEDNLEAAKRAFGQAMELDPGISSPMIHTIEFAAVAQDSLEADRLLDRYLAVDPTPSFLNLYRPYSRDDSAGVLAMLDSLPIQGFELVVTFAYDALTSGRQLGLMDSLFAVALRNTAGKSRQRVENWHASILLALGRPRAAERATRLTTTLTDVDLVKFDAFESPTPGAVPAAVDRLTRRALGPSATSVASRIQQYDAACLVAQWRLVRQPGAPVAEFLDRMRRGVATTDRYGAPEASPACLKILEAMIAVRDGAPNAEALVTALDTILLRSPPRSNRGTLIVARLLDRLGRTAEAYRSASRGGGDLVLMSAYRRERGRLAAKLGMRDEAVEAYQLYLTARRDPEAALIPQRDSVKAELAALAGEP